MVEGYVVETFAINIWLMLHVANIYIAIFGYLLDSNQTDPKPNLNHHPNCNSGK